MSLIKDLSPIFWDTNPETLELNKHAKYIIPRVMDYGTIEDAKKIEQYYGRDTIQQVLQEAPYLNKKTISFFAWKFGLSMNEFRAYRRQKEWKTWP